MLLIVGYSHKDENGSASIIVVNIAITGRGGKGKRKRNTHEFSTLITTNTFARGLLIAHCRFNFGCMRRNVTNLYLRCYICLDRSGVD